MSFVVHVGPDGADEAVDGVDVAAALVSSRRSGYWSGNVADRPRSRGTGIHEEPRGAATKNAAPRNVRGVLRQLQRWIFGED